MACTTYHLRGLALLLTMGAVCSTAPSARAQSSRHYDEDDDREEVVIDTTIAFGKNGVADLTVVSGNIRVTGWDRAQAHIRARAERNSVRSYFSTARIELDVTSGSHRGGEVVYEVSVPYGTRVIAHTTSGDIDIRAVRGEVAVRSTSGDTRISGATAVSFETMSGDLLADSISGDFHGTTVSGDLDVSRVVGDVDVVTTSGEIRVVDVTAKVVSLETVSGEIEFSGPIDRAGRYDFHSHSGSLRLGLPSDAGATINVETYTGTLDSDFPVTLQPSSGRVGKTDRRMELTLGQGGARIRAETFSGDITLERITRRDER